MNKVTFRVADGFEDPSLSNRVWNKLLTTGSSDVVFMTKEWQQIWWDVYGRGKLLIVLAESEGEIIAIAPLFADEGMIFFAGSGGSDYLDFIGDIGKEGILEGILECAVKMVPDFCGFRFYHIPEESVTGKVLMELGKIKPWKLYDEGSLGAPVLELALYPELAESAVRKKSLLRHEGYYNKNGGIEIVQFRDKEKFLEELEVFFRQHIDRWNVTPYPSLFLDEKNKEFYRQLCKMSEQIDWLSFTAIRWQDTMIAYHFGFSYKKTFIWYKPSFEIGLARHSPGEVLLRQLLLKSIRDGDQCFDFGLGEEPFKSRFANNTRMVKTWGLYP